MLDHPPMWRAVSERARGNRSRRTKTVTLGEKQSTSEIRIRSEIGVRSCRSRSVGLLALWQKSGFGKINFSSRVWGFLVTWCLYKVSSRSHVLRYRPGCLKTWKRWSSVLLDGKRSIALTAFAPLFFQSTKETPRAKSSPKLQLCQVHWSHPFAGITAGKT